MQKAERELIDEKFKGVIALITSTNDINKAQHDSLMVELKAIKAQTAITNGRVTKLETKLKFFVWVASNPKLSLTLGVLAFFGSIFLGSLIGWNNILTKIL